MDLDDFEDAPTAAPTRFSRFAPKFSKLKPKPKCIERVEPKMESVDSKAPMKMEDNIISELKEEVNVEDPMEEDDSEDMVVREIDVFFSPQTDANSQLYVLQYPLRPCWRPYELDERCEEVRVNSKSAEMEIDLAIDFDSKNYDQTMGSRTNMTKQTLASSWKPPHTSGYAVGVLMGNNLHLNPVHAIVQLRPSFEHLNADGLKKKDAVVVDPDVKLEKPNTEKSVDSLRKPNKQIDLSSGVKIDDGELWISLKYHGSKSTLSTTYLQRMVAQETSPINFTMDPHDYLNSLCPGTTSGNGEKSKGPSRRLLLSLPLEERIQKLLTEGPPVQKFSVLKHFAPDYGPEEFVEALQKHALLVQGLWTPKSSLVYPGENDQCLARDFTLLLFSQNPVINASQINIHKRYRDKVKRFLKLLAVERSSFKDWKFREHTDVSFIKNYPDVVQKQEKIWGEKEQNIKKFIPDIAKSGPGTTATTSNPNVVSSSGNVTKSISGGLKVKSTMSDETREALPKALQKVFQNHKVCSFQLICQGLRDLAVAQSTLPKADARYAVAAAYGVDAPPDELKRIINQVATEIHGLYVFTSSQEHPEYDPLRKVVIDLLRGKGPNTILKRADVAEAAKTVLGRDMINNEYTKVMNELCISKGSAWVLKSGDGNSK